MSNITPAAKPMKIGRALFGEALKNFNKDRFVLAFPIIAFALNVAFFLVMVVVIVLTLPLWSGNSDVFAIVLAIIGAVFVTFTHVVVQGAVMSAANQRYSGKNPTFASAFKEASEKLGPLALFGLLEATVGLIMRAIRDNLKVVGGLISFIGGLAWAVASYFAIPVILFEGLGPIDAIRRSTEIIKSKWGSALRVNVYAGVAFVLAILVGIGAFSGGLYVLINGVSADSMVQVFTGIGLLVVSSLFLMVVALIQGAVMSYACVAIYRYAVGQSLPDFDASQLDAAFRLKKQKLTPFQA